MSYRSYFFLLFFSLIYSNFAYPILVTVAKFTRNGQTVYLLGDYHVTGEKLAQEEKEQIDLVFAALNEKAQETQRKIQILWEKASTTVQTINFRNWNKVYRFTINIDELLPGLNNPDIVLQDIENRIVSNEIAFLLRCKGDLKYQDAYFDRAKAPKELKDITLRDLFSELTGQAQTLEEDIKNIPTEPERERCREQLEYCKKNISSLRRDLAHYDWPEDKPFIELAKQLNYDISDELFRRVVHYSCSFFESSIGHHILKSKPTEDIVVIAGASHINSIEQYMIGLGWTQGAHGGDFENDLVPQAELDAVMRHKYFSERVILQLKELGTQTQRSISTTYTAISTYLKALLLASYQAQ